MSFVIMAEFSNPSSKISQFLTEKIFPLTSTRGDNRNLHMPPQTVIVGENFASIF